MDPNVPFSDTSARRAALMEATEQYKSSIESNVQLLKEDAAEVGKSVALVSGVCLAVYLVANAILPNFGSDDDEDEDSDVDVDGVPTHVHAKRAAKAAEEAPTKSAIGGAITGLLTSVLTNIARQQVTDFISRLRQNNANQQPTPTQYPHTATYNPVQP
jgi:hypothetical protein